MRNRAFQKVEEEEDDDDDDAEFEEFEEFEEDDDDEEWEDEEEEEEHVPKLLFENEGRFPVCNLRMFLRTTFNFGIQDS